MLKRVITLVLATALLLGLCPMAVANNEEEPPSWITNGTSASEADQHAKEEAEKNKAEKGEAGRPEKPEDPQATPSGYTLITDEHIAYMEGSDGRFYPKKNITRAQAAQIFLRLLDGKPPRGTADYADVAYDAWYAEAAGVMGELGVMREGQWNFYPDEEITRAEFVDCLTAFFPARQADVTFADVPSRHWAAEAIDTAAAYGWVDGFEDGTFHPNEPINRAQAVTILNRALGRSADETYLSESAPVCCYKDVPGSFWGYYDIVEASVPHQYVAPYGEEFWTDHTTVLHGLVYGLNLIDGWAYYYSTQEGDFLRDTTYNGLTYGSNGRFTTGNSQLDELLRNVVVKYTNDSMTQEQKLRALYVYTRDSFKYLRRPAYEFGATGFMEQDALTILTTGRGNCYCYASLFWYLSRWIGYDAKIYSGTVGVRRSPHSWVEIDMGGKTYIYDTELEMAYHEKGRYDINLYKYIDVDGWQYRKPATPAG